MKKMFKVLRRNDNCVLLMRIDRKYFKVRDIENDDIYIGASEEIANRVYESFDINKVREERKELLEKWLEDFAES